MNVTAGRPGFSFDDVAAAADRLVARGERPTVRAVRAELGGGSMGTIQHFLADWRARHRRIEPTSLALPVEVQRMLLAEIERHVASARAGLEADLADVQADREALAEELERQAAALQAAERRVAEQAAELERHVGALEQFERALSEEREQVVREREAAENARKAAALAELRTESLPRLHAEIETLQNKLDEEREARRKAEIEAAELRGPQHGKKS